MSARARSFLNANELSPVVYGSVDGNCVTYRLASGKVFRLSTAEAATIPEPRWSFNRKQKLAQHRNEELELLAKLEREAKQTERYAHEL